MVHNQNKPYFVHSTATVDEDVTIGKGTKIWHYSHLLSGAEVGANCNIGQNVMIDAAAKVGDRCKIQNNVSVYSKVTIEDDVFLGPSCVFTNVINPRAFIERKNEFKETRVMRGATIGANATIVCGVTIGAYAFIGAGAVVNADVPDYALVVGVPARHIGFVCECALRLSFDDEKALCRCGQQYFLKDGKCLNEN